MRVVIIGPGRIGCGYLTPLFRSAGWEVVLAARDEATTERIRRSSHFGIRITAPPAANGNGNGNGIGGHIEAASVVIETPAAVTIGTPAFAEAVAGADLICTSVGVEKVGALAPALGLALAARPAGRPLDVWTVENADCAPQLEENAREVVRAAGLPLPEVGFGGAIAEVAVARGSWGAEGSPEFVGDGFRSLIVDERRLLTGVPPLPDVSGTRAYPAHLHEKLYVFNAGHAICAYLGWLRRHSTIAEAAADPSLRPLIAGSMLEARRALLAAHPSLGTDLHARVAESLARFRDRELADPVARVAREPIRKLAPGDRLLGPAELIRQSTGRVPSYFALAVAGALLYRNEQDEQSCRLGAELERAGVMAVLESVCGLAPSHPFAQAIVARYRNFIITATETIFPPVHAYPTTTAGRGVSEEAPAGAVVSR
jgi:mannitol-1-phosphate 5-dehydrogenase